jgi:hypothetical protein
MFCCLFNIFIQRSKEFYEENAIQRNYFYFMDNRGQLFLEETKRRNVSIFWDHLGLLFCYVFI